MEVPTFLTTVNTHFLSKHFKEWAEPDDDSPYYQYVSKNFYGAVIRSQISLVSLDQRKVVVSTRLKGRHGEEQAVTGVKIDLIRPGEDRIKKYGIKVQDLDEVTIDIQSNIPGNIVLQKDPAEVAAFFYKKSEGSSLITFRIKS